ncbi:MAG: hypothetical protein H7Y22_08770, partial [Gemmatimonadaceae bacterium]|nr:hypothetical protein [Gloeobacterales cyanobacterium ES-bin-141]
TCPEDDHIWGPRIRDDDGRVHRLRWWEDPAFLTPGLRVVFGHYHMAIHTPQAICVDFGAPVGPLAAYLVDADRFVVVPPAILDEQAAYLHI